MVSSARLALPMMPTSRLLKSCAIPPASSPRLSSLSFCSSRRSSSLRSGDVARDDAEKAAARRPPCAKSRVPARPACRCGRRPRVSKRAGVASSPVPAALMRSPISGMKPSIGSPMACAAGRSKELFGRRIEHGDAELLVQQHDGVHGRVHDAGQPRSRFGDLRFQAEALGGAQHGLLQARRGSRRA